MLTALELENFKGIAARQRIEFAPITLLFGANNAGKSTILQSLLYLHELLEHGNADVDRTTLGGSVVELGGFARLVHCHERTRSIVIRAEFDTPGTLERFGRPADESTFPDLDDDVESAWLELTIGHRTTGAFDGPVINRAVIGVNGEVEPLAWLEIGASLRDGEPLEVRVNLGHPLVSKESRALPDALAPDGEGEWRSLTVPHAPYEVTEAWEAIALPENDLGRGAGSGSGGGLGDGSGFGDGRSLPVFALSRSRASALPPLGEPLRVIPFGDETTGGALAAAQVRTFLEMVILGTVGQLASFLRGALYIGPLRAIPPRGFLYERRGRATSWADGLAAWDLLLSDRAGLVERTNGWLARLGARCQIVVQELYKGGASAEAITEGHVDDTVRRLLLSTGSSSLVLPSEVGAGISQVIPIIVAAIAPDAGRFVAIEQPEIHVHPALQVGLGDLFIEARERRMFLVETHSEHLLLRIMKRIRETTENRLPAHAVAVRPEDVRVLLFEMDGSVRIVRDMPLNARGELVKGWPGGFFEEGLREVL